MTQQRIVALTSFLLLSSILFTGCARQETAPKVGRSEVREAAPTRLNELSAGHPTSYYINQLENMGYTVKNADYQTDKTIYELSKGNNMEEMTLFHPQGQTTISQVTTKHLGWFSATREEKNMATDKFQQNVEKLPTGKKADEYIPMLEKYGTVTEYKLHRDDAMVNVMTDKNRYKVRLTISPDTKNVTGITLEKGILNTSS